MAQSEDSLDSLFSQICRLKHHRVRTLLESLGLHRGQPRVLGALWEQEGLTHTELVKRLRLRPATITKMIHRMERAGFVERRPDLEDQRVSRVFLTEAGRAVEAEVHQVWQTLEQDAFEGFNLEERVLLRRFFLQIRENLTRANKVP